MLGEGDSSDDDNFDSRDKGKKYGGREEDEDEDEEKQPPYLFYDFRQGLTNWPKNAVCEINTIITIYAPYILHTYQSFHPYRMCCRSYSIKR